MKALVLKQFGGTENFSMEEISEPQVGKGGSPDTSKGYRHQSGRCKNTCRRRTGSAIQGKPTDRNRLGRGRHRHQGGG